ncbi:MAG TPA: hypothetical protein VLC98_11485 [Phnomibacter sp.]|nr:hypothetical protein [Phnomibacter sp.]
MKKCIACLVLLVISVQLMYPAVFTVWFYANQKAIASKYCENKKRPMLHCDGKCYLAKKIAAAEKQESKEAGGTLRNMWVESMPCILQETTGLQAFATTVLQLFPRVSHKVKASSFRPGVFRPPATHTA